MSFYNTLPQEELADLLRAYDSYISTAADAGLLTTGWTPVCVEEFYGAEYQNVWDPEKGDESFYYMYDDVEKMVTIDTSHESFVNEIKSVPGADIFFEDDSLKCQFTCEEEKRPIRSRIQDIEAGDAFIIGGVLHYAEDASHQNFDEMDEPWIVYDCNGNCWFEEDIVTAERGLPQLIAASGKSKPSLDDKIRHAENKSATLTSPSQEYTPER